MPGMSGETSSERREDARPGTHWGVAFTGAGRAGAHRVVSGARLTTGARTESCRNDRPRRNGLADRKGSCTMFHTFTRCDKRTFDRADRDGAPAAIAKDPAWAAANATFVSRDFTRESVADPYQDGPSRTGERWAYWIGDVNTATTVGPVEYHYTGNAPRGDGVDSWRRRRGISGTRGSVGASSPAQDGPAPNPRVRARGRVWWCGGWGHGAAVRR